MRMMKKKMKGFIYYLEWSGHVAVNDWTTYMNLNRLVGSHKTDEKAYLGHTEPSTDLDQVTKTRPDQINFGPICGFLGYMD